jgi:methylated-DNA-[protein]-cysteine S-methyltransferase
MITAAIQSPFGPIELLISDMGLKQLKFIKNVPNASNVIPEEAQPYVRQLEEYFNHERTQFTVPIDWEGIPEFQKDVLKIVQTIPYGKTRTYEQIAQFLGNSKAARAVGQANGHNPIAIIIPCHRVIGKSGRLRGYAYGVDIKMKLLSLERPDQFLPQMEMFESTTLV